MQKLLFLILSSLVYSHYQATAFFFPVASQNLALYSAMRGLAIACCPSVRL